MTPVMSWTIAGLQAADCNPHVCCLWTLHSQLAEATRCMRTKACCRGAMCKVQCIGLWRALTGNTSCCCLPSVHIAKSALHPDIISPMMTCIPVMLSLQPQTTVCCTCADGHISQQFLHNFVCKVKGQPERQRGLPCWQQATNYTHCAWGQSCLYPSTIMKSKLIQNLHA